MAITGVGKSSSATTVTGAASSNTAAMAMVTTLFFMWGFLTCLNDILIPHLKAIFDLNYTQAMLVQFVFFSAYFVFALPSGKIVERIGYQRTMVVGLVTAAVGAVLFIPAASVPSFPFFLTAYVILAAGITVLQVSANPYVSVLGRPETASSRLTLTQAFNSLGTTVAPFLGARYILSAAPLAITAVRKLFPEAQQAYRVHEASSVKLPYLGLTLTLLALAVVIGLFKLPRISTGPDLTESEDANTKEAVRLWKQSHLLLGVVAIFLYVGAEVSIGSFLVNYLSQGDIGNIVEKVAAKYVSLYWLGAMIGRFIGSAVLQKARPGMVLGTVALVAFLLVGTSMASFGHLAMWSILLVGLFNSVMFPTIFTLGIAGLGPLTGEGSGLLIMAIVGGAIIPEIQGAIADAIGIHHAFVLPLICYLYIAFYGFRGSKPRSMAVAA
jgi:FHS family L-fucose permease-like MFS transporter